MTLAANSSRKSAREGWGKSGRRVPRPGCAIKVLPEEFAKDFGTVPLNRAVLRRSALPMPTVLKTLGAIHLTSALMLQESKGSILMFATQDQQQATAAKALDFEVL